MTTNETGTVVVLNKNELNVLVRHRLHEIYTIVRHNYDSPNPQEVMDELRKAIALYFSTEPLLQNLLKGEQE